MASKHPVTGEKLVEGVNADRRGGKLRARETSSPSGGSQSFNQGAITGRIGEFFGQQRQEFGDFLSESQERLGTNELGEAVKAASSRQLGLEEQLATLPERIGSETRGFDVNAAQRSRIQESRQQPLAQQAAQAGRDVSRATTASGLAQRQLETEANVLRDFQAREASGFTSGLQAELDFTLNRLARGEQLQDREFARVQQLADLDSEFERQKELFKLQTDESIRQTLSTRRPETPTPAPIIFAGGGNFPTSTSSGGGTSIGQDFESFTGS